jgi:ribulose-5-phosphate 4-epimerase/fuculose-1-phosphate aldolase
MRLPTVEDGNEMHATGASTRLIEDLVVGSRILAQQKIVDGFGHISARHDADPSKYLMSHLLAPGLVTPADIVTLDLDSQALTHTDKRQMGERFIHGEIYKLRPDVMSVVHCHAVPLIPFGITGTRLRPVYHQSYFIADDCPIFEIRESSGMTDVLIRDAPRGAALARALGAAALILMRGHGATMVGASIHEAVYRAIYATTNAIVQLDATRLGTATFLALEEAELYGGIASGVMHRPWDMWRAELTETGLD